LSNFLHFPVFIDFTDILEFLHFYVYNFLFFSILTNF
jgi:hypothetical protein